MPADHNFQPQTPATKRPRPVGFYAGIPAPTDNLNLNAILSGSYGLTTVGRVGLSAAEGMSLRRTSVLKVPRISQLPRSPKPAPFGSLDNHSLPIRRRIPPPSALPTRLKSTSRKPRDSRRLSHTVPRKPNMTPIEVRSSFPLSEGETPPVPSLPTMFMLPSPDQYDLLLGKMPSLEILSRSDPSQVSKFPAFGSVKQRRRVGFPGKTVRPVLIVKTEERYRASDSTKPFEALASPRKTSHLQHSPQTPHTKHHNSAFASSTLNLDAFGAQIDKFPSLLHPTSSLPLLIDKSDSPSTSFDHEQLQLMSFGSVKPRRNRRAPIDTCNTIQESSICLDSDAPLFLLDESPSFSAMTKSMTSGFASPFPPATTDHAASKHERLLAAVREIAPSLSNFPESLPSIIISSEASQSPQLPATISVTSQNNIQSCIDMPVIMVTDTGSDEEEIAPSSSSFSILDLYIGCPEMPCLGSQKHRASTPPKDRVILQAISKVNVLRDSVSFLDVPSNDSLSAVFGTVHKTSRVENRRGSFLSPDMPSSFLSMSAINEVCDEDSRRSVYGSSLKCLFRRSGSKCSFSINGGGGSVGAAAEVVGRCRPRSATVSSSTGKRDSELRRMSGWALFKWMKA